MSLIGKQYIFFPLSTRLFKFKFYVMISGLFGKLKIKMLPELKIKKTIWSLKLTKKNKISFNREKKFNSSWGTLKKHFDQSISGIANNFFSKLELVGVGFKMFKKNHKCILKLGFSHRVYIDIPLDQDFLIKKVQKRPLKFHISSFEYELLQRICVNIRSLKKPELYKGKGFRLNKEILQLKEGKTQKL